MTLNEVQEILATEAAVLLYFQNDFCPPCVSLRPKVEALTQEFAALKLVFINAIESPTISAHFGVFAHPTLLVFFDGKEFFRDSKYVSVPDLRAKIERPYYLMLGE